jgi:hypothetical protein
MANGVGVVIEVTDEMVTAFMRAASDTPVQAAGRDLLNARAGLAAALAIVERDYNLSPALCDEPHPTEDLAYCELPRGHAARSGRGHSATVTKAVDW